VTIAEALTDVTSLFLDTAPVIYYVEQNPAYVKRVNHVFDRVDEGIIFTAASSITLAESLIIPYRQGEVQLQQDFFDVLVLGLHSVFVSPGPREAQQAAEIRARYNLSLTDAFQVACALSAGCQALLTNDQHFRQVAELQIIILSDCDE